MKEFSRTARCLLVVAAVTSNFGRVESAEMPDVDALLAEARVALKLGEEKWGDKLTLPRYHLACALSARGSVGEALEIIRINQSADFFQIDVARACLRIAVKRGDVLPAEDVIRKTLEGT